MVKYNNFFAEGPIGRKGPSYTSRKMLISARFHFHIQLYERPLFMRTGPQVVIGIKNINFFVEGPIDGKKGSRVVSWLSTIISLLRSLFEEKGALVHI